MSKSTGLGDDFLFGGYHIGGDIQQLTVGGGPNLLDVTDITQSAHSRLGGQRSGVISLTAFSDAAAGQEHAAFSPLSRSDIIAVASRGRQMFGIDGTAGDAQDELHPFVPDSPGGCCVVCGLARPYRKHTGDFGDGAS